MDCVVFGRLGHKCREERQEAGQDTDGAVAPEPGHHCATQGLPSLAGFDGLHTVTVEDGSVFVVAVVAESGGNFAFGDLDPRRYPQAEICPADAEDGGQPQGPAGSRDDGDSACDTARDNRAAEQAEDCKPRVDLHEVDVRRQHPRRDRALEHRERLAQHQHQQRRGIEAPTAEVEDQDDCQHRPRSERCCECNATSVLNAVEQRTDQRRDHSERRDRDQQIERDLALAFAGRCREEKGVRQRDYQRCVGGVVGHHGIRQRCEAGLFRAIRLGGALESRDAATRQLTTTHRCDSGHGQLARRLGRDPLGLARRERVRGKLRLRFDGMQRRQRLTPRRNMARRVVVVAGMLRRRAGPAPVGVGRLTSVGHVTNSVVLLDRKRCREARGRAAIERIELRTALASTFR